MTRDEKRTRLIGKLLKPTMTDQLKWNRDDLLAYNDGDDTLYRERYSVETGKMKFILSQKKHFRRPKEISLSSLQFIGAAQPVVQTILDVIDPSDQETLEVMIDLDGTDYRRPLQCGSTKPECDRSEV